MGLASRPLPRSHHLKESPVMNQATIDLLQSSAIIIAALAIGALYAAIRNLRK